MIEPWWSTEKGLDCISEIEKGIVENQGFENEFFGVLFLFQSMVKNPEYFAVLQALCAPLESVPVHINSEYESVKIVVKERFKHNI